MDAREVLDSLAKMRDSIASCGDLPEGMDGILLDDLRDVERMGEIAKAALEDAENDIHHEADQSWLREWQDLVYEIEDLVDLYEYQVKALQADAEKMEDEEEEEEEEEEVSSFSQYSTEGEFMFIKAKKKEEGGDGESFPGGSASFSSHQSEQLKLASPLLGSSFRKEISESVLKIKKQYADIANKKEALHSVVAEIESSSSRTSPDHDDDDTAEIFDDTVEIFLGRSEQMEELVGMLQNEEADDVEVIAVTGMGGIGKTTLSRHIYNDSRIQEHFDARGWVYVGEAFNVLAVANAILGSFTGQNADYKELSNVQENLAEEVDERKFLLVMDDVWCEDIERWDTVKAPLMHGAARGSKILLTSRNNEITKSAALLSPFKLFPLSCLSEEDGWSLFQKYAKFVDGHDDKDLVDVGKDIFDRCGRLPLAIKVMGSLLRRNGHDMDKWRLVRDNDMWDSNIHNKGGGEILKPLYMSYLHLPPHLKACFRLFSLIKKGVEHNSQWLICFLIRHALIKKKSGRTSLRERGERLIDSLVSRSLLERSHSPSPWTELEDEPGPEDLAKFMLFDLVGTDYQISVHDLIVDTARYVAGNQFCMKDDYAGDGSLELANDARHLHLQLIKSDNSCIHLKSTVGLRTLVFNRDYLYDHKCRNDITFEASYIKTLHLLNGDHPGLKMLLGNNFPSLKHLRVLSISDEFMVTLPKSLYKLYNLVVLQLVGTPIRRISSLISNLKSLQLLDLSNTQIEKIPESICKLTALEELKLQLCESITMLPIGITKLTNLRSLELSGCSIEYMPQGLSNLTKLRYLPYYPLGSEKMYDLIEDLKCLELQGTGHLRIDVFRGLLGWETTDEVEIPIKGKFDKLSIVFCDLSWISMPYEQKEQLLELLKPHTNIKEVQIVHFEGVKLPLWMGDQSFMKLDRIQLTWSKQYKSLSPLHQLPSLRELRLIGIESLEEVVSEENHGYSSSSSYAASKQIICFPKLEILRLNICEALESLPIYRFRALRKLLVRSCENLKSIHFLNPYSVEKEYEDKENLLLTQVYLVFCPQLHFSSNIAFPSSMKHIKVEHCKGLDTWCKVIQSEAEQGFHLVHEPARSERQWYASSCSSYPSAFRYRC